MLIAFEHIGYLIYSQYNISCSVITIQEKEGDVANEEDENKIKFANIRDILNVQKWAHRMNTGFSRVSFITIINTLTFTFYKLTLIFLTEIQLHSHSYAEINANSLTE